MRGVSKNFKQNCLFFRREASSQDIFFPWRAPRKSFFANALAKENSISNISNLCFNICRGLCPQPYWRSSRAKILKLVDALQ